MDAVAKVLINPITKKPISNKALVPSNASSAIAPQLDLFIDKQKEIDGVGMGVLSDGTAFLNGRGLARLCGVSNARIVEMGQEWSNPASGNAMTVRVRQILEERGIILSAPYIEIKQRSGVEYAYPDIVCLAVLEYYAFDFPKDEAKKNYEKVAKAIKSLGNWAKPHKSFWYVNSRYNAEQAAEIIWDAMDADDTVYVVDASNNDASWFNIKESTSSFIQKHWGL